MSLVGLIKMKQSNSLGSRKNVRITKSSNYRDLNYRASLEIFKVRVLDLNIFARISKCSNGTSSN